MSRLIYGADTQGPTWNSTAGTFAPNAAVSFWSLATGGSQITDLLNSVGGAVTTITSNPDGSMPQFSGPTSGQGSSTAPGMWASAGGAERLFYVPQGGSPNQVGAVILPSSAPATTGMVLVASTTSSNPTMVWGYRALTMDFFVYGLIGSQTTSGVITGQLGVCAEQSLLFSKMRVNCRTLPTDSAVTIDLLKNASTTYNVNPSHKPQVTVGGSTSFLATTPDTYTAAAGDEFTINVSYSPTPGTAANLAIRLTWAITSAP